MPLAAASSTPAGAVFTTSLLLILRGERFTCMLNVNDLLGLRLALTFGLISFIYRS